MSDSPDFTIAGPYKYEGDLHPCIRINGPDRLVGVVFITGDEVDALAEADFLAQCLNRRPEIEQKLLTS